MATIGVAAIASITTTARYLERAAETEGHEVVSLRDLEDANLLDNLDCLIIVDPLLSHPRLLRSTKCPIVGYMIDVHRSLAPRLAYARYLDHVFVAQSDYVGAFSNLPHSNAHWLPLACDRELHFVMSNERDLDVGFVGKLGEAGSARRATLERVLQTFATNNYDRFYDAYEMGVTYSRSKIVFNKSIGNDLNMRFFEALASGALLITDRIGNGLGSIGEDGKHYVTYRDAGDAIEKIRYYLTHKAEREAIARRGQELAFAEHTYRHRIEHILKVVEGSPARRAPVRSANRATEAAWRSEHMKLSGASIRDAARLVLFEGQLAPTTVYNSAIAVGRGFVRPLRRALAKRAKSLL